VDFFRGGRPVPGEDFDVAMGRDEVAARLPSASNQAILARSRTWPRIAPCTGGGIPPGRAVLPGDA
jgi:hypothetical protein